jgi:hypothetical protein
MGNPLNRAKSGGSRAESLAARLGGSTAFAQSENLQIVDQRIFRLKPSEIARQLRLPREILRLTNYFPLDFLYIFSQGPRFKSNTLTLPCHMICMPNSLLVGVCYEEARIYA